MRNIPVMLVLLGGSLAIGTAGCSGDDSGATGAAEGGFSAAASATFAGSGGGLLVGGGGSVGTAQGASSSTIPEESGGGGGPGGEVEALGGSTGDSSEASLGGSGPSGGSEPSGGAGGGSGASSNASTGDLDLFSFFVTSLEAMQELSGSPDGFGGDLRYGTSDGLSGADKICTEIAERSMPGSGVKQWRAFLSVTAGPDGNPVHAKDRIGQGPWYDRLGRLVAEDLTNLLNVRPVGAHEDIVNDLPNEYGTPNHDADGDGSDEDNHDTLTGTDDQGELFSSDPRYTCADWTSSVGSGGTPRCGHSWPRLGGGMGRGTDWGGSRPGGGGGMDGMENWMSALNEAGCAPGVNLIETGPPNPQNPTVGSGGGYGGIYCFALVP